MAVLFNLLMTLGVLAVIGGIVFGLFQAIKRRAIKPAVFVALGGVASIVVAAIVSGVAGEEAVGLPTPTSAPTPTPTPTFDEAKATAKSVSYDDLFRYNEQYVSTLVFSRGKIDQVVEQGGDRYLLRVSVNEQRYGFWQDDVRLDYEGPRVLEGDTIEFVGKVKGLWKYSAILGNPRTIPHISAIRLQVAEKAGGN
jgi:hypothetical protein